jgi:hypothetical protein
MAYAGVKAHPEVKWIKTSAKQLNAAQCIGAMERILENHRYSAY